MARKRAPDFVRPKPPPSSEQLQLITHKLLDAQMKENTARSYEKKAAEVKAEANKIYYDVLPDLMMMAGANVIQLPFPMRGEAKLTPYYRANIAADWPEEKREAAFSYIMNVAPELVKIELTIQFARGESKQALQLAKELTAKGLSPTLRKVVPHQSLTAWLKERVEDHWDMPKLDLIGGNVGQVVKLKEKEEGNGQT